MACPPFERLLDFLELRLDAPESAEVRAHFETGCPKCARERGWYEHLMAATRQADAFAPPPDARAEAARLFERELTARSGRMPEPVLLAQVDFDSLTDRSRPGIRSNETSGRELVYSAAGFTIDIQVMAKGAASAEVMGQILCQADTWFSSVASVLVDLTREEESVWSTVTNDVGEFMMVGVERGEYGLLAETRGQHVRVASVPIFF
ncbi:MAG TPA: hypothetical protein VEZ90_10350 [Blastocatellia bacterium]|nr:hypothetical protein [Blastocatellia bacterium]